MPIENVLHKQHKIYGFYFLLVLLHALPFLNMLLGKRIIKGGLVAAIILFFIFISYIGKFLQSKKNTIDYIVSTYFLICIISVVCYFQFKNPFPIESYIYGLHILIAPMFLYFAIRALNGHLQGRVIKLILYLNVFSSISGLIMYFFLPSFYIRYLTFISQNQDASHKLFETYARLASYFSPQILANVIPFTILLFCIRSLIYQTIFRIWFLRTIFVSLLFCAGILTMQRFGIIATIVATFAYLFLQKEHIISKLIGLIIVFSIIFSMNIIFNEKYEFLAKYGHRRLDNIEESLSSRWENNYVRGIEYFWRFPLGVGLGATTVKARTYKTHGIHDANFIRILVDTGILGIFSFISILIAAIIKTLDKKLGIIWLLFLGVYIVQSIGTNIIDAYYTSHIFWLVIGIISSSKISWDIIPADETSQIHLTRG